MPAYLAKCAKIVAMFFDVGKFFGGWSWGRAIRAVVPPDCLGCNAEGRWVCADCAAVAKPAPRWEKRAPFPLRGVLTLADFSAEPLLAMAVKRAKFHVAPSIFADVVPFLQKANIGQHLQPQLPNKQALLSPVPLHWLRQSKRGYNQSALLCEEIGNLLALPTANLLRRTRWTLPQARLAAHFRHQNLRGIFARCPRAALPSSVRTPILLVDDVYTTGHTLAEAARPLADAGFSVWGLCLLRGGG